MTAQPEVAPVVRAAVPDDAAAISSLLRVLGYPLDRLTIAEKISAFRDTLSGAFVATQNGQIVGLVSVSVIPKFENVGSHAKVTSLVVSMDLRGAGVGRDLVAQAETFAWSLNCEEIWVDKDARPGTQEYYQALGYALVDARMIKRNPAP